MKKTLKIIILTFILSFACMLNLNAETKTLECKYRRNYMGDSSSKYNFDFTVKFSYDTKKKSVTYSLPKTVYHASGIKYTLNGSNLSFKSTLNKKYNLISNGECPVIYTSDVVDSGTGNSVLLNVSENDLSTYNTGYHTATVLDDDGNDSSTGATSEDKICNIRINSASVGSDVTRKNEYKIYEFKFVTKPNGSVFLTFGQDSSFGEATRELSGTGSDTLAQVWTLKNNLDFTGDTYVRITSEEAKNIKSLLSYSSKTCPNLYLNYTGTGKVYELSTKESSSTVATASEDFSVDNDATYTELISKGVINMPISDEIGTCETYLGNADTEGTIAYYLQIAFTIIKVVSIVIVIVTAMIDLASVVTSDKDNLMDTVKKYVKRLIILIIILLLPTFIDLLGTILGLDNILCGIK